MTLLVLISVVFGLIILMVLLTLISLEDQGARTRLKSRLMRTAQPRRSPLRERLIPVLEAVSIPEPFRQVVEERTLAWAGVKLTQHHFHALWWLLALFSLGLGIIAVILGSGGTAVSLLAFFLIFCAAAGPYLYLQDRIRRRGREVERSLPDFLDMLTFTVEAGLGLVPALKRVSRGFQGILSEEMEQVLLQIDLGFSQREALRELSRRLPSSDVEHFVEAILLSERLGTSLARTMRVQSSLLRTRRRQRAEVKAQTAPIRIIPALVFFFLPSLLLIYLAPPIINFLLRR